MILRHQGLLPAAGPAAVQRGFEILPQVNDSLVYGVVFESLFRGWNQAQGRYTEVSQQDRDWLLAQARVIREQAQAAGHFHRLLPADRPPLRP